jgi:hypothetical protein
MQNALQETATYGMSMKVKNGNVKKGTFAQTSRTARLSVSALEEGALAEGKDVWQRRIEEAKTQIGQ